MHWAIQSGHNDMKSILVDPVKVLYAPGLRSSLGAFSSKSVPTIAEVKASLVVKRSNNLFQLIIETSDTESFARLAWTSVDRLVCAIAVLHQANEIGFK